MFNEILLPYNSFDHIVGTNVLLQQTAKTINMEARGEVKHGSKTKSISNR